MLNWLKARSRRKHLAERLYEGIVAHSRLPAFYARCGVSDTMNGRLEMILVVVVLVLTRLKAEGPEGQRVGQLLMERLVVDLDDAFRQIGIGDDGIARRVPQVSGALKDRVADYGPWFSPAPASGDNNPRINGLAGALLEHVYRADKAGSGPGVAEDARRLAEHLLACSCALHGLPAGQLHSGELALPTALQKLACSGDGRSGEKA